MPALQCISHITPEASKQKWQEVCDTIVKALPDKKYDDGSYGPLLIRLAWHSCGTWDRRNKTGGSNGATMRFEPESSFGNNAGLDFAREWIDKNVKSKHPWASYADLYILASIVAIETSAGPVVPFRPGRKDLEKGPSPNKTDILPNGQQGLLSSESLSDKDKVNQEMKGNIDHVRHIFNDRFGYTDQEVVAIIAGGHAYGRCHPNRSGFVGKWQLNPLKFSNVYCKRHLSDEWRIVDKGICEREKINLAPKSGTGGGGCPMMGNLQFVNKSNNLMLLLSERSLFWDEKYKKWLEVYAKDEEKLKVDFGKAYQKLVEFGCEGVLEPIGAGKL